MLNMFMILAQADADSGSAAGAIVGPLVAILVIAGLWRVFTKAGKPGWAALIPIYNFIVLLQIAGKPAWWFLLFLIPGVNFVILILVMIGVAKAFGKGTGFTLGLLFLSPIFVPVLGFGNSRYVGTAA
jgi:hypothetical protein